MKPAAFLDRDGTIIRDVHYLSDPAKVELLPGAAAGMRLLRDAGYACVVVSNQSAVARGIVSPERLASIHEELCRQLLARGVALDGWYFCAELPTTSDRTTIDHPDRKPGPGMLLRAARELDLDLGQSWMIGDMVSDVLAGYNAGCRGSILVRTGHGTAQPEADQIATHIAADLFEAARWVLNAPAAPAERSPSPNE
jgi:D-glycero-D-manno-heptose 1,7-bisphosphate phosphatase